MNERPPLPAGRLGEQLEFLLEADRLKGVLRQTLIGDGSRFENTAEHSWHAALYALVLAEHAREPVDTARVVAMLVVHDLVEIDAGDTYAYDEVGQTTKVERERAAADRVFGLLPPDQGTALRSLWEEFEAGQTADAGFAHAMDRITATLLNHVTGGQRWLAHGVAVGRVRARGAAVGEAAPALGEVLRAVIDDAVARGWLREEP
jgi:putative hydrolases of HD superfamily